MKFIKSIVLALVCTFAAASYAQGTEEICHRRAEVNVQLKHVLLADPKFLEQALKDVEKGNLHPKIKALIRENYFWVWNRKDMSDEDIRRLSFIACLVRLS